MSDIFREIDEDIRHDRAKAAWDKYGAYALGAAVAIVLAVAGFKGFVAYQKSEAEKAGARYTGALNLAREGKSTEAMAALEALEREGPGGYPVLAQLRMAAAQAEKGQKANAIIAYDKIADTGGVDGIIRSLAKIRSATLRLDDANEAEMKRRLEGETAPDAPFRHSARELLALSAWRAGNHAEAERRFLEALGDRGTPAGVRSRSQMMLSLIAPKTAAKSVTPADKGAEK